MSRRSMPSPYQEAIFRFVEQGSGHGIIMATAGSGKSTTLVEVAHRLPKDTRLVF
jgi:DNA helicase-2/ATP-dependent DNA helicase PcrA